MPIKKFHRVEDMPVAPPLAPDQIWAHIAALWSLSSTLHQARFPPGVHKNRNLDEANARRLSWLRSNVK